MVVLQPQAVWFWAFHGIRPELWVLLPTSIGIAAGILRRQFDLSILATKKNFYFLVLWLCLALSYYFGAYVDSQGPYRFDDPDNIFGLVNKMMLLYFMASLSIDTERKITALYAAVCGSALYLIYWANSEYFSGHLAGERLAGPTDVRGSGIYHDENAFAMLFVVAQSFIWYFGFRFKRTYLRFICWLAIPFCWHAVFLTASRGGLVGLGVTTLLVALRSKQRLLALALVPAFIVGFLWQGGHLMKARADTISQYQNDNSAETRLQAWRAAARMIADKPLLGVGLASFGPAFPNYSADQPREAHNTVLQITAESGIPAGAMYILIVVAGIASLWKKGGDLGAAGYNSSEHFILLVREATLVGLCGLVVCSMFLSLQVFEIFFLLHVLANAVVYLERKPVKLSAPLASPISAPVS
jgi:O-antigen ligase